MTANDQHYLPNCFFYHCLPLTQNSLSFWRLVYFGLLRFGKSQWFVLMIVTLFSSKGPVEVCLGSFQWFFLMLLRLLILCCPDILTLADAFQQNPQFWKMALGQCLFNNCSTNTTALLNWIENYHDVSIWAYEYIIWSRSMIWSIAGLYIATCLKTSPKCIACCFILKWLWAERKYEQKYRPPEGNNWIISLELKGLVGYTVIQLHYFVRRKGEEGKLERWWCQPLLKNTWARPSI